MIDKICTLIENWDGSYNDLLDEIFINYYMDDSKPILEQKDKLGELDSYINEMLDHIVNDFSEVSENAYRLYKESNRQWEM